MDDDSVLHAFYGKNSKARLAFVLRKIDALYFFTKDFPTYQFSSTTANHETEDQYVHKRTMTISL